MTEDNTKLLLAHLGRIIKVLEDVEGCPDWRTGVIDGLKFAFSAILFFSRGGKTP